ncbi:MAG: amino acid ABC transporter permease [Blautia sp.]|nr:amino acid ABC transporter permease [Blautia sp.]
MRAFHPEVMIEFYVKILPYLKVTFTYVFFSLLFGFLVGALVTVMRLSRKKALNCMGSLYITVMRCVPSVVLLFLIFFGLSMVLENCFGSVMRNVGAIVYVTITFSLLLGASTSEIMRSAYLSVSKGQYEAAVMSGLSGWDAFRRIILPQAFHAALPNVGNIVIYMIKEGALAYTIGLQDVLGRGYYLNGLKANVYNMEMYLALTLIYWPCTVLLEHIFAFVEKRFSVSYMAAKGDRKEKTGKEGMAL